MFRAFTHTRRERSRHHLRAVALIMATLVFANIVAFAGLGVAARAEIVEGALPYAPVSLERPAFQELDHEPAVAVDRTMIVSSITPIARSALRAERPDSVRNFVATRSGTSHRLLLIAIMLAALAALGGVSLYMFRNLAGEVAESDRRRRMRL